MIAVLRIVQPPVHLEPFQIHVVVIPLHIVILSSNVINISIDSINGEAGNRWFEDLHTWSVPEVTRSCLVWELKT